MFTKKNCIPCQGGVPPLNDSKIKSFKKLVDESWKVSESKQIISEFNFSEYPKAIKFTNQIADLAEEEGHHPYIHINFKTGEPKNSPTGPARYMGNLNVSSH